MPNDLFQPVQIGGCESLVRIYEQHTSGWTATGIDGHRQERPGTKLFACRRWRREQVSDSMAGAPIPSKAAIFAVFVFPAKGHFHCVGEEGIGPRGRYSFRTGRLSFRSANFPHKDPFKFIIANCQAGLLASKFENQLAQRLANRLG